MAWSLFNMRISRPAISMLVACPRALAEWPRAGEFLRASRSACLLTLVGVLIITGSVACVRMQSGYGLGPSDDGTAKAVEVGSELRLALPDAADWKIETSDASSLRLKSSAVSTLGESAVRVWLFDVRAPGTFVVRATRTQSCDQVSSSCAPAARYQFTIQAVKK